MKSLKNVIIGAAILLIAVLTGWFAITTIASGDPWDVDSQIESLEERFNGEVTDIQSREPFVVFLHNRGGVFEITVDQETGMILSMTALDMESRFASEHDDEGLVSYSFEEIQQVIQNEFGADADILESVFVEDDPPYYDVIIRSGNQTGEIEINALTGEILVYTVRENAEIEPINQEEAERIALEEHPGEVDDVDLEERDGRLVYEIEIDNEDTGIDAEIIIDAYSGEILSIERD